MTIHAPEIPATESTLNDLPDPLASDAGNATDDATTELNPRQEAVWRALVANPGSSATTIGAAADMSRVAAGKILNQLEADGRARRTPGGQDGQTKGRTPDRWYAIDAPTIATDGAELHDTAEAALTGDPDPVTLETPADSPEPDNTTIKLDARQEGVLAALYANPGWPAAPLSVLSGLTKKATTEVLRQLEAVGLVSRPVGEGEDQNIDEWYLVSDEHVMALLNEDPDAPAEEAWSANPPDSEVPDEPLEIQGETDDTLTSTALDASPAMDSGEEDASEPDAEPVSVPEDSESVQARRELLELADLILGAAAAMEADGDAVLALGRLEMAMAKAPQAHRNARAVLTGTAPARSATGRTAPARSTGSGTTVRPSGLRDRVLTHLTEHPGKDFTPYEIGRVLDSSSGAVANALDRLVSLGQAELTCERPRRFSLAEAPSADA